MKEKKINLIRKAFIKGKRLTRHGVFNQYTYCNLPDLIYKFKREGLKVKDCWKTSKNGEKYKEYFLEKSI